jgi:hypothetical protein
MIEFSLKARFLSCKSLQLEGEIMLRVTWELGLSLWSSPKSYRYR